MAINAIQPVAPNKIQKKSGKKIAGAIVGAAALTGAALYLAKTGRLNAVEGGNPYIEKLKAIVKKPADLINGKIADKIADLSQSETLGRKMLQMQKTVKTGIKLFNENPTVGAVKNFAKVEGKVVKDYVLKKADKVGKSLDTVLNLVESKIHPEKYL